jgi:hypothetical protein
MRILTVTIGASLILGGIVTPAVARMKPQPTMCFVQLRGGVFRDLSTVCGASDRSTQRLFAMPTVQPQAPVPSQAPAQPQATGTPATPAAGVVDRQSTPSAQSVAQPVIRTTTTTVSPATQK